MLTSGPTTNRSLIARIRDPRDQAAWGEFTAVYEPVIYRMARRRGTQDADAREIVQEVLMSVVSSIDRFDPDGPGTFRGWLSRVTRNATIDRLRRLSSRRETVDGSGVARRLEQLAADGDTTGESLADEFDRDRREQLFRWAAGQVRRRTSEVNWIAFWRTAIDGRSVAQAAAELGIGEGAVYVARCRVLKRIREVVDRRLAE